MVPFIGRSGTGRIPRRGEKPEQRLSGGQGDAKEPSETAAVFCIVIGMWVPQVYPFVRNVKICAFQCM